MKIFSLELPSNDPITDFSKLHHLPYSLLMDSADRQHPDARYSYILSNPLETIEAKDGTIAITSREKLTTIQKKNLFSVLQDRMDAHGFTTETLAGLPPFQGGLAGLFSYDIGRTLEAMPDIAIGNPDIPDLAVGLYDQVIAYDHKADKSWLITHARNMLEAQMKQAVMLNNLSSPGRDMHSIDIPVEWTAQFKPAAFKERIEKVRRYILNGDIFQANLAQKFKATLPAYFSPFAHYQDLRAHNPAPFAAYMNCGDIKISCASPERFLSATASGHVQSKPIKGTMPRSTNPAKDQRNKDMLQQSVKDKAENIMITDLLRNDLSKVCETHSIEVTELCALESFASVHHLVSTISGQLRTNETPLTMLEACFPGGSITGAPKIRAMEIIEECEPTRRGVYCGSIAMIGFNGFMDSNIIIRTLIYDGNSVSFQVGSGITASSDPDAEYQETMDKARALFESFDRRVKDDKLTA